MAEGPSLKEKTSRGLFWGGTSSLLQQLLNAAFGIYLARTLSPDDYGLIGMLTIFNLLAYALQDGGFVSALINRKEIRLADYNAVFWFSTLISLACYLVFFFCAPLIAAFFHRQELLALSRWNFLGFVFFGLGIPFRAYLMKTLQIREISISNITAVVISGFLGVFLAYRGFAYWALVAQGLVYSFVMNAGYWIACPWKPSFKVDFQPVKQMFHYGSKLLITNIFGNISNSLVSVVLGRYYTGERVGYYTQANKWYMMGSSVLTGMVNSVAQPVLYSVEEERERQVRVLRKMIRFAAFITFPAMAGLAFIAPEFITTLLSDKWADSIPLLQILCIGGMVAPMTAIFINLILSKGGSTQYMYVNIALFVLTLSLAYLLHPYGVTWMVTAVTIVNVLWLFVWLFFVRRAVGYTLWNLCADLLPFLGITVACIVAAYFLTRWIADIRWLLVAKILVTAALYVLVMWLSRSVIFKECIIFVMEKIKHN